MSGREEEREGREEGFPPLASSRDGSNFRREETRGERRGKRNISSRRNIPSREREREFPSRWKNSHRETEKRRKEEEREGREEGRGGKKSSLLPYMRMHARGKEGEKRVR